MGRDEQEGISLVVEYLLGDVVTGSIVGNGKVVDGRHIAFFHQFTLAFYECPCGVGIVVEGKLATLPVFLHHKGILVAGHLGALGYLHTLADVGSHMIGAEIEARQQVQAVDAGGYDIDDGIVDGYPLVVLRHEAEHTLAAAAHHYGTGREHHVLEQRLRVGEVYGVAEAATVAHGVGYRYPYRDEGHHRHKRQYHPGGKPTAYGEEDEDAQRKLERCQRHRRTQREPVGHVVANRKRREIIAYLVLGTQRVDGLDISREDECHCQHRTADIGHYGLKPVHSLST